MPNFNYDYKFYQRLVISVFVQLIFITGKLEAAEKYTSSGPYCGVACLYVAMDLNDKKIDFANLVKPEYIGSHKGSSLAELKKAAEDNGVYAEPVGNLSSNELKVFSQSIILHVKSSPKGKEYNHYVLFLGDKDGKAKIFDPPNPVEFIPYYELASQWDGTGLIVSAEPINLAKVFAPARKRFAIFAAAIIAAIVIVKIAGKYLSRKVGNISKPALTTFSVAQSAGLVFIALFAGVIYHFANDEGFLAHAGATESVVKTNLASFIPKVSAKDIQPTRGTVIIDARQTPDYEAGHIDGAINIPTTLCAAGRNAKLAEVAKNSRLIIYCQSAGCPYAEKVAVNLMEDGFNNLAIYKGGWVDWDKRKK
jgi:rhodanese-related sulfurtransferase